MKDTFERLSKRQRESTPLSFARYLVDRVRDHTGCHEVSALWVRHDTVYRTIEGVDCWDKHRNAYLYAGPHPVVCHPYCGPWGKYRKVCKQPREDGLQAIMQVSLWGGVIEQPLDSRLFKHALCELEGAWFEEVNQGDFGFPTQKPTVLYWYFPDGRR